MATTSTGAAAEPPPGAPAGQGGRPVHDVLVSIPFRHRLSTKLLGMSAVLALAALAALWFAERRMQQDLLAELQRSTGLLADAIQASSHRTLLGAGPAHAYAELRAVGDLEGVERVRVLDKRGRVVFSTEPLDVGTVVQRTGHVCVACHGDRPVPRSRAPAAERTEILEDPGGRVLAMMSPVHNGRGCATAACHVHPPGRQVLGLLELRVSLSHLDASVLAFRRGFVLVLAAAVLVVAALLYLFGRAEVVEPVAALLEGTRRVARDELDLEVRVHARGELGVLAASFNEMTGALRRLEGELAGVMSGLERQVEARTAELKAAQETLLRAEKLSSLGKLSASIAHEINNPLAGILTFAKLVSRVLAEGAPDEARRAALQKNLALIERETQRCSAIVRNLLDFTRDRPMKPGPLDPRRAVEEVLTLVGSQAHTHGITLERDLAPVPDVQADFGQLRQAFLNIAVNACEAMGSSGRLRVSTRAHDGAVEIAFSDTGPGIPSERVSRIFDPFFTTKEKGTGLGLSVVYGIVERHGGVVDVESAPGVGTTFTIRLPICAARAGATAAV
jgi:two-component system NtrC family sensor kinase